MDPIRVKNTAGGSSPTTIFFRINIRTRSNSIKETSVLRIMPPIFVHIFNQIALFQNDGHRTGTISAEMHIPNNPIKGEK